MLDAIQDIKSSLSMMSTRLDNLEMNAAPEGSESDNDQEQEEATAHDLRKNARLQREVRSRMAQLDLMDGDQSDDDSDTGDTQPSKSRHINKLKSGRSRTADDVIAKSVDWPHYYVYRGNERRPAQYEELSIAEFTFGYLAVVSREKSAKIRDIMLQHLQELMQDAVDFPWESVRNFHAIFLHQQEMDRITWNSRSEIAKLRQIYVMRPLKPATGATGPRFCLPFQAGKCTQAGDHQTQRGQVKHICAYCLKSQNGQFPHPEKDCKRKQRALTGNDGAAKNDA